MVRLKTITALLVLWPALAGAQATIIPNPAGGSGGGGGGSVTGGACSTNMVAVSNNSQAVPGCVTVTSAYVDTSIAKTGVDINTSNQVIALHLPAPATVEMGGTGLGTYAVGDILYASGATTLSKLADVAVGNVLRAGGAGVGPAYGPVNLTTDVANILPSANGGVNNAFVNITGPTTTAKSYALPNASTTILTTNAAVTVAQGGTGAVNLAAHGVVTAEGTGAFVAVTPGASGTVWTSTGTGSDPVWQAVSGTGTVTSVTSGAPLVGSGTTTVALSCPTCTTAAAALPAHYVLVGAGSQAMTAIAPSITGYILTSVGGSTDPVFQPPTTIVTENPISSSASITGYGGSSRVTANPTAVTVSFPTISGNAGNSEGIRIAPSSSALVTLQAQSGETLDGNATFLHWAGESSLWIVDTDGWHRLSGHLKPMICSLIATATQSVTATTTTKVNLDAVVYDNTGLMADTTNHVCNIKRTGYYIVSEQIGWQNIGASSRMLGWAGQNGNGTRLTTSELSNSATGAYPKQNSSQTVFLNAGDTVELDAYNAVTYSTEDHQSILTVTEIVQ